MGSRATLIPVWKPTIVLAFPIRQPRSGCDDNWTGRRCFYDLLYGFAWIRSGNGDDTFHYLRCCNRKGNLDLSPFLRQPVKRQYPANGGTEHGIVSTKVHA